MANEEQLSILKQGVQVWNKWREDNPGAPIDLTGANLREADLRQADLHDADLSKADLSGADLYHANISGAKLWRAYLGWAILTEADLTRANLIEATLRGAHLKGSNFSEALVGETILGNSDLRETLGLGDVIHTAPSSISTDTFAPSKGKIPDGLLKGYGLSDWEIASVKLYNPDLSNEQINDIQYEMNDLRAQQPLQISSLFISYSHADDAFVDKLEGYLNKTGVRFWRDVHDATSGRLEKQIDRAIRLNPTVLLILSENSFKSNWVEHEVRMARELEQEMRRDVLCPVALDSSWKSSPWPKQVMEQILAYHILDFSTWEDDSKFEVRFRKLIDGLELFYKG